jgi:dihydrofolate reductase
MGKLVYSLNVSLDGFIATPDGGLDWATVDEEVHSWFNDQTRAMQAALYGRRLYELMAGHWPTAEDDPASGPVEREFSRIWKSLPKFVFSTTLESVDHNARLVRGDVATVLQELRREFDGDLEVGGPNLAGQFVRNGLVDEYQLMVHPVVLGTGVPFWPPLEHPLPLRLKESRLFESGVELRSYVPA